MSTVVDGSNIRTLVEDKQAFSKYVNAKFKQLHDHQRGNAGTLSPHDLEPIVFAIGNAMGLPPKGSSPDSDHIYDEIMAEFVRGRKEGATEEQFGSVLGTMLLGVADGLQREPIALTKLDGAQLEHYTQSPNLEMDAVAAFSNLDTSTQGRLKGDVILRALSKLTVEQGMPPASDSQVMKSIIGPALERSNIGLTGEFTQNEFVGAYCKVLLEIAHAMRRDPVSVAHVEKTFDGKCVSQLLRNKIALNQALEEAWKGIPKEKHGNLIPKNFLRAGVDLVASFAGLPPLRAAEQMDRVVEESLMLVDADKAGESLDKEGFCNCMMEILGGIMLQLEGKPISVKSNTSLSDAAKVEGIL